MSGTVTAVEKEGYYPSKKPRVIPKVVVPVEHPKYRKAGPKGKCLKCGEKMEVKHRTPMKSGKVHLTYVCSNCRRPRVGIE